MTLASAVLKIITMPINIRRRKSNTLLQLDWCGTDARDGCGQEWKGNFLRCGSRAQHLIFVIQFSFMFFGKYVYIFLRKCKSFAFFAGILFSISLNHILQVTLEEFVKAFLRLDLNSFLIMFPIFDLLCLLSIFQYR